MALYRVQNNLRCTFRPPDNGTYYLTISGQWVSNKEEKATKKNSYQIVKFKVKADDFTRAPVKTLLFPADSRRAFGPTDDAIRKKISSQPEDSLLCSNTGTTNFINLEFSSNISNKKYDNHSSIILYKCTCRVSVK